MNKLFTVILLSAALGVAQSRLPILGTGKSGISGCSTSADTVTGTTSSTYSIGQFGGQRGKGMPFVAGGSYTICSATIRLSKTGTAAFNLHAYIYTNVSSLPGAQVGTGSASVAASSVGSTEQDVVFSGMSVSLTSGTTYWLCLVPDSFDGSNYINWAASTGSLTIAEYNGSIWDAFTTFAASGKFTLYR